MMSLSDHSETDDWIDAIINNGNNGVAQPPKESEDPFHELNEYLGSPPVSRAECPNPISWWGVSVSELHDH